MNPYLFGALMTLLELVLIAIVCLCFHRRGETRGLDRGRDEGLKEGYRRGFTDAQAFSELWWQVAENDVQTERAKLGKVRDEERWP